MNFYSLVCSLVKTIPILNKTFYQKYFPGFLFGFSKSFIARLAAVVYLILARDGFMALFMSLGVLCFRRSLHCEVSKERGRGKGSMEGLAKQSFIV